MDTHTRVRSSCEAICDFVYTFDTGIKRKLIYYYSKLGRAPQVRFAAHPAVLLYLLYTALVTIGMFNECVGVTQQTHLHMLL